MWDKNVVGAQFHTSLTNMSSTEEDILVAYWFRCRVRRKRKYWVHPYNLTNVHHNSTVVSRELSQHESKFREFYPMNSENFHFLKNLVTRIVSDALMSFNKLMKRIAELSSLFPIMFTA
jgi:hypothetical protein